MELDHYHNLLRRQLKKLFGSEQYIPPEFSALLHDVNRAYVEFDNDRTMLERSLDLSSQELLQANSEMRGIFQALPDVYFLLDEQGTILDCKGGIPSDFVLPPEQLIGKTIWRYHDCTVAQLFRSSLQQALASQQDVDLEYSLLINGKTEWFEARMVRLTGNKVIVLARNITTRKRSEQHLEQSYSLLRATLESTADGILVVDSKGKIETYNQQFLRMWKIPEKIVESGLDSMALEFVLDQLREPYAFVEKVHELYAHPEMESFDVLEFKDGRIFERFSKPQIISGKSAGRVWSFRDVTERKNLEEHLRQSQKLQTVGTLAGGVAHDFNNLLTIILGYCVSLEARSNLNHEDNEKVAAIKIAAKRGAGLVRQLLTIARKTAPNFEPLNINDIIIELVSMFRQTFPKTINVSTGLDQNLPSIIGDHNQIHQSILNICLNARDAVQSNGAISIRTGIVHRGELLSHFSNVNSERYAYTVINDTGLGMDEATQARIFEPFFSTKEPGKGTGLGLAVVYGIVNSHNGMLRVESKVGVGTSFFLYFPIPSEVHQERNDITEAVEKLSGNQEQVLLVEDEAMVRNLMKTSLESSNYRVLTAVDGVEAVERFEKNNKTINVIVMDIGLPKLNGWDAYKKIQAKNPAIKAIFISGYADPELKEEIISKEKHSFLQKPFSPLALLRQIRKALDEKK